MEFLPQYDELWVVSDIHMGGERSFQIFPHGKRLAKFIEYVGARRPNEQVALVLNGDIIDSLAEDCVPGYVALDVDTALRMMERIAADEAFAPVWKALADFVCIAGRHLIFVLGNHDIELALAPVEAWVRKRLAGTDASKDARIAFSTRGGGFGCRVGDKRVFCTHGNEVDGWNVVDYSALGSLENAMNAGRRVDSEGWIPNAGTRMVIDLMNDVKRKHPFVDLLKPEIKPVLSVLLTLDPALVKKVDRGAVYRIIRELMQGNREVKNLLSANGDLGQLPAATLASAAVNEVLGVKLAAHVRSVQDGVSEDELLLAAERDLRQPRRAPIEAAEGATLGWSDIVSGWLGLVNQSEALRHALQDWLGDDTTFDLTDRDATFRSIVERVGPGVDFVVTGHTHLARAIEYAPGRHYFNCGTWIRLLRLTTQALADEDIFKEQVFAAFEKKTMEALDAAKIPGPDGSPLNLVLDRTDAVRISRDETGVSGALLRVVDSNGGLNVDVEPEKGGLGE